MKRFIVLLISLFFYNFCFSQPTIFSKNVDLNTTLLQIVEANSQYILFGRTFQAKPFTLGFVDTVGNLIVNQAYGGNTGKQEISECIRKTSNGELLLMGRQFYKSSNYQSLVIVLDTFGNFKREFTFKQPGVSSNSINDGFYMDGYYYFIGPEFDSTFNYNTFHMYVAKTDTFGNVIWRYRDLPNNYNYYARFDGRSINGTLAHESILIGDSKVDSNVNFSTRTSYLLLQIDTAGNFVKRIPLPQIKPDTFVSNIVNKIMPLPNNTYMILGSNNLFTLDKQFNILKNDSLVYIMTKKSGRGTSLSKSYIDNSFAVSGPAEMVVLQNGNLKFQKDFSELPNAGVLIDVITTKDGGYFAVVDNKNNNSYYLIKMDCDGNYINPPQCTPPLVQDVDVIQTTIIYNVNNWQIQLTAPNKNDINIKIYSTNGKLVQLHYLPKGSLSKTIYLENLPKGIYMVNCSNSFNSTNIKAVNR